MSATRRCGAVPSATDREYEDVPVPELDIRMLNVRGTVALDSRTLLYLLQWCRTSYSTVVLVRNPALVVPHMPSTSPSALSSQQRDNYELFTALVRVVNSHFNYRKVLSRPQLEQPQGALVNEVDHGTITKDWGVG